MYIKFFRVRKILAKFSRNLMTFNFVFKIIFQKCVTFVQGCSLINVMFDELKVK